jgi:hypothetical protein
MRALSAVFVVGALVVGTGACGALSGISDYESVSTSADASPAGSSDAPSGTVTSEPVDGGGNAEDLGTDASADDAVADDSAAPDVPDVELDAAPACSPKLCGGCCQGGICHGGQSVSTCGKGGDSCSDCTSEGACSSAGTCVAPVVDAGTPKTCTTSQCTNVCIPFYQGTCCKSDGTCGCQVVIPAKGSCG